MRQETALRLSSSKAEGLVRLANVYAEQAPNPRGNDAGRSTGQFLCWRLLLDASDYDGEQDEDEHHHRTDHEDQDGEH